MADTNFIKAVRVEAGSTDGDAYYMRLPAVQKLQRQGGLKLEKPVTFFVGENGAGKSTLLEGIAVAAGFNPEGGTVNFRFTSKDTHSGLHARLRLVRRRRERDGFFLRAESFYNVASEVDRLYEGEPVPGFYGGRSLHGQSHGESFMALVTNRFRGEGLYVLDEPEAALSPSRQMALLAAIHGLVARHSQFIIATHSPILLAYPEADIYVLDGEGLTLVPYKETGHYTETKRFLDDPDRMLRYLLGEDRAL